MKRGECVHKSRPCARISCRHHMIWWFTSRDERLWGAKVISKLTSNNIVRLIQTMEYTCVLDIVDEEPDGMDLTEFAEKMHMTKQRVHQLQQMGMEDMLDKGWKVRMIRELRK